VTENRLQPELQNQFLYAGYVLKSLKPGAPGTKQWLKEYGRRLVRVRYRGNPNRRVRSTTVEIVVDFVVSAQSNDEVFWDPDGYVDLSSIGQST
jgi:hypothetical protein